MPDVLSGSAIPPFGRAASFGTRGLPRPLTSFIGRERELAQAKRLLEGSYLVTLTGPGGSGKTRLCIALASDVAGDFPDGVYFVPLAPVRDPELVPSTIAQSIGLQDARDLDVVTTDAGKAPGRGNNGTGPVILVRPDGHVGARGRPGSMHAVTDYLHDLFGEPASDRGAAPAFRPGSAAGIVVF